MKKPIQRSANWWAEFQDGEVFVLKGHSFHVVRVTKRGLAFRKVKDWRVER
jgi:uncharacterized protein YaiE (UPF0345 family)